MPDVSIASLDFITGLILLSFGTIFGSYQWSQSAAAEVATPTGVVTIEWPRVISGIGFSSAFFGFGITKVSRRVLSTILGSRCGVNTGTIKLRGPRKMEPERSERRL